MKADLLLRERRQVTEDAFVEARVWRVPAPVRGLLHDFKYSLALVVGGECVLRYDNEAGKGDHRHVGHVEAAYAFRSVDQLLDDFRKDVNRWLQKR